MRAHPIEYLRLAIAQSPERGFWCLCVERVIECAIASLEF